jgi:hypothetical protein
MGAKKHIPVFMDVDLTITEEYQEEPLIRNREEKIKKSMFKEGYEYTDPVSYLTYSNRLGGPSGTAYLTQMVRDARPGGALEGLNKKMLFECGTKVISATKLKEGLTTWKEYALSKGAELHIFFVSVGIVDIINGFIEEQGLNKLIDGVAASKFTIDKKGVIDGISEVVTAFGKNAPIIGFMKGDYDLLDIPLFSGQYRFNSRDGIVMGDGLSDISMFAYGLKKGMSPVSVYEQGDYDSFKKTVDNVGAWVTHILPRNFSPEFVTFKILCDIIDTKLERNCDFRPSSLYDFKKGNIENPNELECVKTHLKECRECQRYYDKTLVTPERTIERHSIDIEIY